MGLNVSVINMSEFLIIYFLNILIIIVSILLFVNAFFLIFKFNEFLQRVKTIITLIFLIVCFEYTLFYCYITDYSIYVNQFLLNQLCNFETINRNCNFFLSIDLNSVSCVFILLTTMLIPVCILINMYSRFYISMIKQNYLKQGSSNEVVFNLLNNSYINKSNKNSTQEVAVFWLIFLELTLILFFTTDNLIVFYITFEASMIPLFIVIGIFGSRVNRIKAANYLFFFTLIGSIFFLVAILIIWKVYGTLSIFLLSEISFPEYLGKVLWVSVFIPLSVKVPVVPVHIWLPEAHVEASTEGSILLAGLLLKIGLFGIIKILLKVFSYQSNFFAPLVFTIALISIIYISATIFVQLDAKKIIAYSSIVHMNFVLIGLFSNTLSGIQGSIYLMFTHGVISSGMFAVIGFLYSRYHTRIISYYQGLTNNFPIISSIFFILSAGNAGIPGTGGFIGEFLIILGIVERNIVVGLISMIGPLFGAIFSILLYSRIFLGVSSVTAFNYNISGKRPVYVGVKSQITSLEYSILFLFAFFTVQTGFFPNIYLKSFEIHSMSIINNF